MWMWASGKSTFSIDWIGGGGGCMGRVGADREHIKPPREAYSSRRPVCSSVNSEKKSKESCTVKHRVHGRDPQTIIRILLHSLTRAKKHAAARLLYYSIQVHITRTKDYHGG